MAFMNIKSPIFVYLDIGVVGTFVKKTEEGTEPGYVNIFYKPLNQLRTEKLPFPVQEEFVHHLATKRRDIPGVEDDLVIVHTGEQGSLMEDVIDAKNLRIIEELRQEKRQLQMQNSSSKQIVEDAMSGAESTVARAKRIAGSERRNNPFSPRFPDNDRDDYNDEFDF